MIAMKNLDAALGAEIADIDLSKPLPRGDVDAIEAAWRERLVVVFQSARFANDSTIADGCYFHVIKSLRA